MIGLFLREQTTKDFSCEFAIKLKYVDVMKIYLILIIFLPFIYKKVIIVTQLYGAKRNNGIRLRL
jgi:hypothetical protein